MASNSQGVALSKRRSAAPENAATSCSTEDQQLMPCPSTPEKPRKSHTSNKLQSPSLMSPPSKGQHTSSAMGFLSPVQSHAVLSPTTPNSQDYYHYALGLSPFHILPSDSPSMHPFSPQRSEPPTLDKFCWSPASPQQNVHDEFTLSNLHSPMQMRGRKHPSGVKALDFADVVGTPSKRQRSDSDTSSLFSATTPYDANAKVLFDRLHDPRSADSPVRSKIGTDVVSSPSRGITIPFPVGDDMDGGDLFNTDTEQASAALLSLSTSPIRSPTPRKSYDRTRKPSGRALDVQFASPTNTPSTARAKSRSQRSSSRNKKADTTTAGTRTPVEKLKKSQSTPMQSPKKKSKVGSNGKLAADKGANGNEEALGLLGATSALQEQAKKHEVTARSAQQLKLESPKRSESATTGTSREESVESPTAAKPPGCNCKRSRCLKLYCECFQQQKFCQHCNCRDCQNREEFSELRQQAIESILERNPVAFEPKIKDGNTGGKHITGCHCKKSACLKKYCECFQAGVACADKCRCIDCQNKVGGRIFAVKTPEPRKPSRAPTQSVINTKASVSSNRVARVSPLSLNDTALVKESAGLQDALKDPAMAELTLMTLLSSAMTPQQQTEALAGVNIDPVAVLESLKSNLASAQLLFGLQQNSVSSSQAAAKRFQRPTLPDVYALDNEHEIKPVFGPNAGPTAALRATAVTLSYLDDASLGQLAMTSRCGRDSLVDCGFVKAE